MERVGKNRNSEHQWPRWRLEEETELKKRRWAW